MDEPKVRKYARALLLAWAAWWVYFAIASSMGDRMAHVPPLIPSSIAAAVFFGSVFLAWRWEREGGAILVVESALVAVAIGTGILRPRHVATLVFLAGTLAFPPFVGGMLLMLLHAGDESAQGEEVKR